MAESLDRRSNDGSGDNDLATIQQSGVQYLGLIYAALQGMANNPVPVPATASSPGTANQWALSSTHVYFCVATDTWCRVAIATF